MIIKYVYFCPACKHQENADPSKILYYKKPCTRTGCKERMELWYERAVKKVKNNEG